MSQTVKQTDHKPPRNVERDKGTFKQTLPNQNKIEPFVGEPSTLTAPITLGETIAAAKKLKKNRAPGSDEIPAEMVK